MTLAMSPSQEFTLERLERLLSTDKQVFWRHDIDFDPAAALQMAQFETRLGIRATYFVRLWGHYSPVCDEIGQIAEHHDIGIHPDLELPRDAKVNMEWAAKRCEHEWKLLNDELGGITRSVAFHAPPRDVYWRGLPDFAHMLGPRWKDRYIGDSRGVWRVDPEEFLATAVEEVQVNLHPEWWHWPPAVADFQRKLEAVKP